MIGQGYIPQEHSSIPAEQGLLGILLVWPDCYQDIIGLIEPDEFYEPAHGAIFTAIKDLQEKGERVSPVSIKPHLAHIPLPPDYIPELAASVVSKINIISYTKTIRDYAKKRDFLQFLDDLKAKASITPDIKDLQADVVAQFEKGIGASAYAKTKYEVMSDVINSLTLPPDCYPIGLPSLNETMGGGLYAGFTYGIAGAEKSGKTTLAQTISYNLNATGIKHAYFALEMGSKQIEQRNMARTMGINSLSFLGKDAKTLATKAANVAATTPDHTTYYDMPGCNFDQIKSEILRLKNTKGFILDYWQLIAGGEGYRADYLFSIVQWIAAHCRRTGMFSIVLSQLNRDGKVLGSAGLERACDQLYILGKAENAWGKGVYVDLTHSRYTPTTTLGSPETPHFEISTKEGPYIVQAR